MAIYQFLPTVKLEISAEEWKIKNIEQADDIAIVMSEKISSLIQEGWYQIANGKSFSSVYQTIEREFEKIHTAHLSLSDMDCMKVFYKLLDNFFPKEMVERVQNSNLLKTKILPMV
jgi:hypothetical protein